VRTPEAVIAHTVSQSVRWPAVTEPCRQRSYARFNTKKQHKEAEHMLWPIQANVIIRRCHQLRALFIIAIIHHAIARSSRQASPSQGRHGGLFTPCKNVRACHVSALLSALQGLAHANATLAGTPTMCWRFADDCQRGRQRTWVIALPDTMLVGLVSYALRPTGGRLGRAVVASNALSANKL
jgi:hypothetical protein